MDGIPEVRGRDLRCSDKDRERVAAALREAAGEGRLTLSELEERLDTTFKARTYGELEPITHDLPQGPYPIPGDERAQAPSQSPVRRTPATSPGLTSERITTVLGDERREGRWEVPARLDVTCFLGEVRLDFTEAIVRHKDIVIQIGTVMGSVTLIVPDGIDVRLEPGTTVLGDRKHRLAGPVTRGGPVYRVRGFVVLGEITVRPPRKKRSLLGG